MLSKSPSPPPPIRRQTRLDNMSPPVRPQASKAREAPSKATEKPQSVWKESMTTAQENSIKGIEPPEKAQFGWKENMSTGQKKTIKGKSQEINEPVTARRGSGAGEPRVLRPSSHQNQRQTRTHSAKQQRIPNEPNDVNLSEYFHVPTFHTSQRPIANTLDDARNILMRSTFYNDQRTTLYNNRRTTVFNDQRARKLDSAILVKPQYSLGGPINVFNEHPVPGNVTKLLPSTFSAVPKSPTQPQQRRRLGRSPSPPTIRMASEQSRATNTPPPVEVFKNRDSKTNLKEELSRLKLTAPRYGSIGAASLGARRDAPADRRAPSVRSDERPIATQGDMLNSIKFQRRFRETITGEKRSDNFNDKPTYSSSLKTNTTSNDKPTIRNISCRTSSAKAKPLLSQENRFNNPTEEKPDPSRRFFRPSRPSSPKGRRSPCPSFY